MDCPDGTDALSVREELRQGWQTLLTSTLGVGLGYAALVFYTFGLFIDPIAQEFGWSRGDVSAIFSYGSVSVLLAGPFLGWAVDRLGFRVISLISIPLFSVLLFTLSELGGSLTGFKATFIAMAIAGLGTTPIVYTRAVNERFNAAKGMALGLTLIGTGVAAILLPPVVSQMIATDGWRAAFRLLALFAIVPWIFVAATGYRRTTATAVAYSSVSAGADWTSLKSRLFWHLGFGFFCISLAVSAIIVHLVPMLRDSGMTQASAVASASLMGFGVIFGRLIVGWLLDRIFAPYLISLLLLVAACGILSLAQGGAAFAPTAALMMGFVLGAEVDLIAYLTARYFGMKHYSFLFSILYTCFALGAGIGPGLLGQVYERVGAYQGALWAVALQLAVTAGIFWTLPRYGNEQAAVTKPA